MSCIDMDLFLNINEVLIKNLINQKNIHLAPYGLILSSDFLLNFCISEHEIIEMGNNMRRRVKPRPDQTKKTIENV